MTVAYVAPFARERPVSLGRIREMFQAAPCFLLRRTGRRGMAYFLRIASAARMRQAKIAAVQMAFQTFSGIFVLRFIVAAREKRTAPCLENRPMPGIGQYTISSQGRPYSLSLAMKGAGSNSSMLKTPGPFQIPVASIIAPIMAGTPVV